MPGLAVAPSPVAPNISSTVASSGSANGVNDAANSDTSFSSALQRSMKSNNSSADKPAHNEAKANTKAESQDTPQSSATTSAATTAATAAAVASQTTAPADALASLLPMLQGKFSQLAQGLEQSDESKTKTKKTTDDDSADAGSESLLAGLAGAMGAQQQFAQPATTAEGQGGEKQQTATGASLAGQAAIIATDDALTGQAQKGGDKNAAESSFQNLLDSAQSAQQAQHQDTGAARATGHSETRIETPVGHERWTQEVGDKLTWMVNKQESTATLVLNPPHMGRVEVSVTINGDQANASFVSANPAVREVLEGSLPRLKEVLADAGIQLGQAQVGADSRGDASQDAERRDNRGHNKTVTGEVVSGLASASSGPTAWTRQGSGMVDTFV